MNGCARKAWRHLLLAGVIALAVDLHTGSARATGFPDPHGLWLPIGIEIGGALRGEADPDGLVLGAEASVARLYRWGFWFGVAAGASYDLGVEAFRHRVVSEVGFGVGGVEVGYVGQSRDGSYLPGVTTRLFGTVGLATLYGGYTRLPGQPSANVGEVGVLLKLPLRLAGDNSLEW